jgi:hypothetical protein
LKRCERLVGRQHSRWEDKVQKYAVFLLDIRNGKLQQKIELEEENWAGHDPKERGCSIRETERERERETEKFERYISSPLQTER